MKHITWLAIFLIVACNCHAQSSKEMVAPFRNIVKLIRADKAAELARLVKYPLKRQNPLPDIHNAKAFVADFNILFDTAFKEKLKLYNDTDIFEHNGAYGLVGGVFSGDIWLNDNGLISSLNYSSKHEQALRDELTKKIQGRIYPGVNSWTENILVAKSNNLLIRIDETKKGTRYVAWSKGRPNSGKPDLVLYNGIQEFQGTMGGWTWTFKNGDWTYIIDDVEMCEEPYKDCGLFLRLLYKDVPKSSVRLTETK